MRWTIVAALGVIIACGKGAPQNQEQQSSSAPTVAGSPTYYATADDSVLESSRSDTVVTTSGDTLVSFGGTMLSDSSARDLGIDHYAKNGNHSIRVTQLVSRRPDGKPIWKVIARLPLPDLKSPDDVAMEGLCDWNGKNDPLIFGVTGEQVSSFRFKAVRAWRVDPRTKTVPEIAADSVTCAHAIGDD
jgi:hypothetical protein